jgi:hypothetical protein
MTDEEDGVTIAGIFQNFHVNFGDKRAGGVDLNEAARLRGLFDQRRNAMRRIDENGAGWNVGDVVDESDAARTEVLDYVAVMNDFVIDVNRCAAKFENFVDAIDGHIDTGAETARVGENDLHNNGRRVTFVIL